MQRGYDHNFWLTSLKVNNSSLIYGTQFLRDNGGRITNKTERIGGVTTSYGYVFDPAGRLIEVQTNGVLYSQYTYDGNGNRLYQAGKIAPIIQLEAMADPTNLGKLSDIFAIVDYGKTIYQNAPPTKATSP